MQRSRPTDRSPARRAASILALGCALGGTLIWVGACSAGPEAPAPAELAAVDRSLRWLSLNPPDARRDPLGELVLDAMAWHVLASLHPDAAVRRRAGETLDARLRALPPPGAPGMVALSYWAPVLALAARRGVDLGRAREVVATWDVAALREQALPHTRLWIDAFLHDAGLAGPPDPRSTLLFRGPRLPEGETEGSTADAYRLFHELVPLTAFGTRRPRDLDPAVLAFARELVPRLLRVTRADGDVDAVAEALVCSGLLGLARSDLHRETLGWLLGRQRGDGTWDLGSRRLGSGQRHVVLTTSWAILAPRAAGR